MNVIPFVNEGLGNSSYLVDLENGRGILIDPDRSASRYLSLAADRGLEIIACFETHLHADFVSGVRELNAAVGSRTFVPSEAKAKFDHDAVRPGQVIDLEGARITAIASPGHSPEHLSYLLEAGARPGTLFSGGSLIVRGAGRTDLLSPALTEPLSRAQFRTIVQTFSHLPDETLLYPTHGAGSFCSAGGGVERTSSLGEERRDNPIFAIEGEQAFADWFPTTFPGAPAYYFRTREINQVGPRLRRDISLPTEVASAQLSDPLAGSLLIDTRSRSEFAAGHIPGSISIVLSDSFCVWLGWLIPDDVDLFFVTSAAEVDRVVEAALLVGYERLAGWTGGSRQDWPASEATRLVSTAAARAAIRDGAITVDVREPDEYIAGHIPESVSIPLGSLTQCLASIPGNRPIVACCGVGDRASTAVSLLARAGFKDVMNLDGGFEAWSSSGLAVEYSSAR